MTPSTPSPRTTVDYAHRHLCFGWWSLLLFAIVGITLETLHGFKVSWYLDVGEETRRLMWRLAHAHGAFLSLVNIAFALTLRWRPLQHRRWSSACLLGASLAVPAGLFAGGWSARAGDPGVGIVALPVGAVLLIAALAMIAWDVTRRRDRSNDP